MLPLEISQVVLPSRHVSDEHQVLNRLVFQDDLKGFVLEVGAQLKQNLREDLWVDGVAEVAAVLDESLVCRVTTGGNLPPDRLFDELRNSFQQRTLRRVPDVGYIGGVAKYHDSLEDCFSND